MAKGKLLIGQEEEIILKVALKTNKTISELMREPFNYILSIYYMNRYETELEIGSQLLKYFKNQSNTKR